MSFANRLEHGHGQPDLTDDVQRGLKEWVKRRLIAELPAAVEIVGKLAAGLDVPENAFAGAQRAA
jgi:hypothetical protein